MSLFARGKHNPASNLVQPTTFTDHVSAPRRGSVDESSEPQSGARVDLLVQLAAHNAPHTSESVPSTAGSSGGRFTLSGFAQALGLFAKPGASGEAERESRTEYSALVNRVQVLERENEEKVSQLASAADIIAALQNELSTSITTISDLRVSLDSTSRNANDLSKLVEEQAVEVQRLERLVSALQITNETLERKVEDQVSQMKLAAETSARETVDYCKERFGDVDAERRTIQTLQSSLESLQMELCNSETRVTTLTREKNDLADEVVELQERCRIGELQQKGLERDLANANARVDSSRLELRASEVRVTALTRERNDLADEVGELREQLRHTELMEDELRGRLADADARARDLQEKAETLQERATNEKTTLTTQSNELRRLLDDAQRVSAERSDRIQYLETSRRKLRDNFKRLQTLVNEKDRIIEELGHRTTSLEEARGDLEARLIELEDHPGAGGPYELASDDLRLAQASVNEKDRMIAELEDALEETRNGLENRLTELESTLDSARETGQHVLEETIAAHEEEMALVKDYVLRSRRDGLEDAGAGWTLARWARGEVRLENGLEDPVT